MEILIATEKHGTSIYDASTPEDLARASLYILKMRLKNNWYGCPNEASVNPDVLTPEQIEALPNDELKRVAQADRATKMRYAQQYRQEADWYGRMIKVVESNDLSMVTIGRGRWERRVPVAWQLLEEHSDYEYERVELEEVLTITSEDLE